MEDALKQKLEAGAAIRLCVSILRQSITNDEIVYIPAGYYHLVAGEFQLNNEHLPLGRIGGRGPLSVYSAERQATSSEG